MAWQTEWNTCMVPNYGTPDLCIAEAEGDQVVDVQGHRYTDLLGGIAVNVLGHCHPEVKAAVTRQVETTWHVSNLYAHPEGLQLARTLRDLTGRKSLFVNSGTEANEVALKLIRRKASDEGRDGVVLAFEGSFHGRTTGSLSLTGQASHRAGFDSVDAIIHVPWNDVDALEQAFRHHDVIGAFFEPIQGEGGVHPMLPQVAQRLGELARANQTVLVADEVQTGIGRTGSLWGHDALPIKPDIITAAKGLGGGWPLGACLIPDDLAQVLGPGTHGCTFGGHPVAAAAANATLQILQRDGLPERARVLEKRMRAIAAEAGVELRGRGMLLGFPLESATAGNAKQAMQDAGYLVGTAGASVVRIAPPLTITEDALGTAVRTLCGVIHALEAPVAA